MSEEFDPPCPIWYSNPVLALQRLRDAIAADILTMSDDEIRAELLEAGEDPDEVAARVKKIIDDAIARFKK